MTTFLFIFLKENFGILFVILIYFKMNFVIFKGSFNLMLTLKKSLNHMTSGLGSPTTSH